MPGIAIGSRIRKSPFYAATVAAGATDFTVYNHMYMPTSFGEPIEEYRRLTEGVAVWDVAAERQVEISGPDAAAFTQYLSARNLQTCRVGRARYAPLCDHDGILINDPVILRVAEDRYWLSIADSDVLLWAKAVAAERRFDVIVREPDVSPLAIQGPMAERLVADLFGVDLVASLGFFHHIAVDLGGIPLVLCRSGWSKQGGFELFLTDGSRGTDLWNSVMSLGAPYGIGPGSPNHTERLESGLLSFASDTDEDTDPFEAGLGAFVDLDGDHDFIGKAALIKRQQTERHHRRLVNVTVEGAAPYCENPWFASTAGERVGQLRNLTWSSRLGYSIGVALVNIGAAEPGTLLEVDAEGQTLIARVSETPFGVIN
jgi:glycine cleavage system aminomethyltransferase T